MDCSKCHSKMELQWVCEQCGKRDDAYTELTALKATIQRQAERIIDTENIIAKSIGEIYRLQCGAELAGHIVMSQCIDIFQKHQKEFLKKYSQFLSKEPPEPDRKGMSKLE